MSKKDSKKITITQIKSPIGRKPGQKETLIGLGLNKMHKTVTLENTPSILGMVEKVKHMLKVHE
jgi:large subunit ribosomal protein L30